MWNNAFPNSDSADLRVEESPMLIGVMQRVPQERKDLPLFDYQSRVLLRHDPVELTTHRLTIEEVIETLDVFREEWYRNVELPVGLIIADHQHEKPFSGLISLERWDCVQMFWLKSADI